MKNAHIMRKGPSDKIAINRYKIYRVTDILQLAYIFYPAKNATHRRAAFIAIYFEIKNAPNQRLETTDHIADKYDLHPATIVKARTKMVRLGLITKQRYGWQFCSVFKNTLEELVRVVDRYKTPIERPSQREGEMMWVEMAKGELKKENQETDEEFIFGSTKPWKTR
jgi:hypothetical protein